MTVGSSSRSGHSNVGRSSLSTHERYHHHDHHSHSTVRRSSSSSSSNLAVCSPTSSCVTDMSDNNDNPAMAVYYRASEGARDAYAYMLQIVDRIRNMELPPWMRNMNRVGFYSLFMLLIAGLMFLAAYGFCQFVCAPRQRMLSRVTGDVFEVFDSVHEALMAIPRRIFC